MTTMNLARTALSGSLLALVLGAAPAHAVAIRKTSWVDGDPSTRDAPATRGTPPSDSTGPKMFDRAHEEGRVTR